MSNFKTKDLVLNITDIWGHTFYRIFPVEKVTDTYILVNNVKYTLKGKALKGRNTIEPLTAKNYKMYLEHEIRGRVLDLYSIPTSTANRALITIDKSLELSLQASKHILDKLPKEKGKAIFILRLLEAYNKLSSLKDDELVKSNIIYY